MSTIMAGIIALLAAVPMLSAQTGFPRMTEVTPATARAGDIVTAAGQNLDTDNVAELFLTDNESDLNVRITEQSATEIKFTVPDSVEPGRFEIVIRTPHTESNPARDYVQPFKVTIEE